MKSRRYGRPARWTSAEDAQAALLEAIKAHAPQVIADLAGEPLACCRARIESVAAGEETPPGSDPRDVEDAVRRWQGRWGLSAAWCEEWANEQVEAWAVGFLPAGEPDITVLRFMPDANNRSPFEIEGETIPVTVPEPTPDDPKRRERWLEHRRWLESRGRTVEPLRLTPDAVWRYMAWYPDRETRAAAHARLLEWAEQRIGAYLDRVEAEIAGAGLQDVRAVRLHAEWYVRRRICRERVEQLAETSGADPRSITRAVEAFATLTGLDV